MKVYFEITGRGGNGKGEMVLSMNIYVNPTKDGHAYHFDSLGIEHIFAWADPSKARCYDSSELPKKLWYSILHGTSVAEIPAKKEDNWTLDDLKYNAVKMSEVKAWSEVCEKIDTVKSIDDFKALYPILRKSKRCSMGVMRKFFSICNIPEIPEQNGEIGMAYFQNLRLFHTLLKEKGIE